MTARPAVVPSGAQFTCHDCQRLSQAGTAPVLSYPTTLTSGVGPKSQSHEAVSATSSGSASGFHSLSAAGSSSTNRSYATWLTCITALGYARRSRRPSPLAGVLRLVLPYWPGGRSTL